MKCNNLNDPEVINLQSVLTSSSNCIGLLKISGYNFIWFIWQITEVFQCITMHSVEIYVVVIWFNGFALFYAKFLLVITDRNKTVTFQYFIIYQSVSACKTIANCYI